jgi:hypothetical protein
MFRKLGIDPSHGYFDGIALRLINELEVVPYPREKLMPRSAAVVPGDVGRGNPTIGLEI